MSRSILAIHVNNSFTEVLRLFSEMTFHHLPVVNTKNELIGIISSNDILKFLTTAFYTIKEIDEEALNQSMDIADLMTPDPVTIEPEATIDEALQLFSKHHIHALPVLKGKKVVGILTSNDILKYWSR